jgi:hypothetical protein
VCKADACPTSELVTETYLLKLQRCEDAVLHDWQLSKAHIKQ